jgi:hypothetical protein
LNLKRKTTESVETPLTVPELFPAHPKDENEKSFGPGINDAVRDFTIAFGSTIVNVTVIPSHMALIKTHYRSQYTLRKRVVSL